MKCLRTANILNLNAFLKFKSTSAYLIAVLVLFFAVAASAEAMDDSVSAIIQGRKLALQILKQRPAENFSKQGVLIIKTPKSGNREIPIICEAIISSNEWQSVFRTLLTNQSEVLTITIKPVRFYTSGGDSPDLGNLNSVRLGPSANYSYARGKASIPTNNLGSTRSMKFSAFADSDFWLCDLGLEFFRWPQQKILPKTTNLKRGRAYTLLESTNPNPTTNGYSRVLSWIDQESSGILQAEAYDAQGKLLKVFEPKSFKKINGQWELQEMEIRNVQTGSRTRLEFDLKKD